MFVIIIGFFVYSSIFKNSLDVYHNGKRSFSTMSNWRSNNSKIAYSIEHFEDDKKATLLESVCNESYYDVVILGHLNGEIVNTDIQDILHQQVLDN